MIRRGSIALFIPHRGCPHQCSFCDQRAISGALPVTPERVRQELQAAFSRPQSPQSEIAFFGGSFTCLPESEMVALLREAMPYLEKGMVSGIRCSTRPDGIDRRRVELLRQFGVTTVELGAQSMDDRVLALNGRGHTTVQTVEAVELLRQVGLQVGLQMMVGMPFDTQAGAMRTARRIAALGPDGVRIYPAVVLEGTRMARWYRQGIYTPLTLEQAVALCGPMIALFERKGIAIWRVGLHDTPSLREGLVAGPFHPAFKEYCLSFLWRQRVDPLLGRFPLGEALLLQVPPREHSAAVGQHRENLRHWAAAGYPVTVRSEAELTEGFRLTPLSSAAGCDKMKERAASPETAQKGSKTCF